VGSYARELASPEAAWAGPVYLQVFLRIGREDREAAHDQRNAKDSRRRSAGYEARQEGPARD